jgi:hypothetical protein
MAEWASATERFCDGGYASGPALIGEDGIRSRVRENMVGYGEARLAGAAVCLWFHAVLESPRGLASAKSFYLAMSRAVLAIFMLSQAGLR